MVYRGHFITSFSVGNFIEFLRSTHDVEIDFEIVKLSRKKCHERNTLYRVCHQDSNVFSIKRKIKENVTIINTFSLTLSVARVTNLTSSWFLKGSLFTRGL